MRKLVLTLILAVLLTACAGEAPVPTATLPPTDTLVPTVVPPTLTLAPTSTATPVPPTDTPTPTATPLPPTMTPTNPPPTAPPATNTPSGPVSFVPARQSVWEVPVATDNMVGICASSLSVPYGLIAITQEGNTLTFRDQGVGTYTFQQSATNIYRYSGRSNIAAGNLDMTLTFLSSESWVMHAVTVLDDDATCQHIHDYTAVFKWVR